MKFLILLLTSAVLCFSEIHAAAIPHGQESHGGDPLALEFAATATEVIAQLTASGELREHIASTDLAAMRAELDHTRIVISDAELYVDGQPVAVKHTVDHGEQGTAQHRIEINRNKLYDWLQRGGDLRRIVFHELLWLIGKDDSGYRISRLLRNQQRLDLSRDLIDNICSRQD